MLVTMNALYVLPVHNSSVTIIHEFFTSGSQSGPYDWSQENNPWEGWWALEVNQDTGLMEMEGDSTIYNWFGTIATIVLGAEVTVDSAKKIRIGMVATLNAEIRTGIGAVYLTVYAALYNENFNKIDQKQIWCRGFQTDYRTEDYTPDFGGGKYKLDAETTLQPNHTYYACIILRGDLYQDSHIHSTTGDDFATLTFSSIVWNFYT
jgi:hypothetical protein